MRLPGWEEVICGAVAAFIVYRLFAIGDELAAWLAIAVIIYVSGYFIARDYLWRRFVRGSSRHTRVSCNRKLKLAAKYGALFWFAIPFLLLCLKRAEKRGLMIRQTYEDIDKAMS